MFKNIIKLCVSFSNKIKKDNVDAFSAQATLFIILSFFPFLMFLLTLLRYLPFTQGQLLEVISRFMPSQVSDFISMLVDELYSGSGGTLLSITIIITLWTASKGILGIYSGLNAVYHIPETRNYMLLRLRSMIYTLLFAVMLIMLLALFVFGNQIIMWITAHFPIALDNRLAIIVISFKNLIGLGVLFLVFLIMYKFIPNRKSKFIYEMPGALIAAVGWLGFSYLYSFYIDNMGNMKATYGSLTAIVLCMLWLYACMTIMFFGAEVNSVLVFYFQKRKEKSLKA